MLTGRRLPSLGTGKGWLKVGILAEILELWPRSNRGTQEILSPINFMLRKLVRSSTLGESPSHKKNRRLSRKELLAVW